MKQLWLLNCSDLKKMTPSCLTIFSSVVQHWVMSVDWWELEVPHLSLKPQCTPRHKRLMSKDTAVVQEVSCCNIVRTVQDDIIPGSGAGPFQDDEMIQTYVQVIISPTACTPAAHSHTSSHLLAKSKQKLSIQWCPLPLAFTPDFMDTHTF